MVNFSWGGKSKMHVPMEWRVGDDIWKIGDLIPHQSLPNKMGIVEGVEIGERLNNGNVRYHYVVAVA